MHDGHEDRRAHRLGLRRGVRLLTGADTWRTHPEPAVGLGVMVFSDGPAGVRGPGGDERSTAALLPRTGASHGARVGIRGEHRV
ncbi:hypothetical protein AMK16_21475 [Streptomyces sp. CB00455]|uniref:hypothetical protein n=1 Tax=Streptomyces sp. CB00455 TaxID=1703927 RepID=UPI00093D0137|nr:hypothetical protein AMK16_21475 [Streptomyces sp. CB00455]